MVKVLGVCEEKFTTLINAIQWHKSKISCYNGQCSVHHVKEVVTTIQGVGGLVKFPTYSPDLNPVDEVFAEIKLWIQLNDYLSGYTGSSCTPLPSGKTLLFVP